MATWTSRFYTGYPIATNPQAMSMVKKGTFEDLQQYVACRFNLEINEVLDIVLQNESDAGMFMFDDKIQEILTRLTFVI